MASGKRAGHVAPPRRKPVARPAAVHEADDDDDDGPEEHGFGGDDDDDDNDDDDEEDEVDDQEAQLDAQLRALQDELASVPFEQLAQMKQRMSMLQKQKKARAAVVAAAREAREQEGPKSKHRPVEMSSKKRVPYLRQVVENTAKHSRDPRFDAVVGKLNKEQFGNAYSFLDSYRSSEINMLQKQLKTEKDEQRRMDVQRVLTKMQQAQKKEETEKASQTAKREHLKVEKELVKLGKKPFYLKKSESKKLDLVQRYDKLKDKPGQLDRAIEKRRRRTANKDHRFLPYNRRSAGGGVDADAE